MMKRFFITILFTSLLVFSAASRADAVQVSGDDTIQSVLTSHVGKRVAIRTKSGQELTGTVTAVTGNLTHLSELAGKEYFDAVVATDKIESVTIRTKQ